MRKKIPWLSKEERRSMEILRGDLERQLQRTRNPERCKELERQILNIYRDLAYDE